MTERLYRSPTDRMLAGVAGGLAEYLHVDPSLVRVGWVILAIFTGGIFLLVYIVMAIVVPLPPPGWVPGGSRAGGSWASAPGPGAMSGWRPPDGQPVPDQAAMPPGETPPEGTPVAPPPAGQPAAGGDDWQETETTTGWSGALAAGTPPAQHGWGTPPPTWQSPPSAARGPSSAGIVLGGVLVVLGVWFLVRPYVDVNWDLVWPAVIIGLGVLLLVGALRRGT